MANGFTEKIVISVGGSLIVPNGGIDTKFLSNLNSFIRKQLAKNRHRQFFLITGGGNITRHYQKAAGEVIGHGELTEEDSDWLGIHVTRLNGHLLRTIFRDLAHPVIIDNYDVIHKTNAPVVIGAGWKPGWSTDYDAVAVCEDYMAKEIINLSNVDKVFDKDPRKFNNAKPIDKISWKEFRKIVGNKWSPGINVPFDPIASRKAQELGIRVVFMSGYKLENLENYMSGKKFEGTTIEG